LTVEYEFSLRFRLPIDAPRPESLVERLGEMGCTDALVGLGLPGYLGLDFVREADDAESAVLSAIDQVLAAIPDALLVEAGPDYVGLTEVANLLGRSRQNLRQMMLRHIDRFPTPVHGGSALIWHLAEVLEFVGARRPQRIHAVLDVARTAMQINLSRQQTLVDEVAAKRLKSRLLRAC
jgi:predicted DNA-binding transcriptional regulator AlpA